MRSGFEAGVKSLIFALAQAETMLRHGRHVEAVAHAESAADDPSLKFRALSVAGCAAHLASVRTTPSPSISEPNGRLVRDRGTRCEVGPARLSHRS